ncbi:MAG: alpha/beta hydrolase [Steroidobacteraceae bacterium]
MAVSPRESLPVFATGGRPHAAGQPLAMLVHGAGMDHTVWALQSRWLAFHGWNVVALDLPGHGRSPGAPPESIDAIAQIVLGLIARIGAGAPAVLIGHSMGSLAALRAAALAPVAVSRLVLIGTAAAMPVHPDLLGAAKANDHAAIDMVNLWGYGFAAGLGGCRLPGVWMAGAGERILERAAPGVLHNDLAACNAYRDGLTDAAKVSAPTLLLCGERDQMTPLKSAKALGAAIKGSTLVALPRAGHMLMIERPYEVIDAIAAFLRS